MLGAFHFLADKRRWKSAEFRRGGSSTSSISSTLSNSSMRLASCVFPPFSLSPNLPFSFRLPCVVRRVSCAFLNPPLIPPPPSLSSFGGQAGGDPLGYAFSHRSVFCVSSCVLRPVSFFSPLLPLSLSPIQFSSSLRLASFPPSPLPPLTHSPLLPLHRIL